FSPNPSQVAVAYSVCRSITRSAAKNFYYAFLVLPLAKRQALCAVYAYMRRCDDIADDFKIPVELLDQLAYGTGMDIQDSANPTASGAAELQVLYRSFSDLRQYCYRVASVVGLV